MRKFYAITCYESPFGSEHQYTSAGMRTEVIHFSSKSKRDAWARKPTVWPERFRSAVSSTFVVQCPADHTNVYVRDCV